MMSKIEAIMTTFCLLYPHRDELSKARLTKMVYLADWRAALKLGHQITPIRWEFSHYGPYVHDITQTAIKSTSFKISQTTTMYGSLKEVIEYTGPTPVRVPLTDDEMDIARFIIEKTQGMYWARFLETVYATYPVVRSERYDFLDLEALARDFQQRESEFVLD